MNIIENYLKENLVKYSKEKFSSKLTYKQAFNKLGLKTPKEILEFDKIKFSGGTFKNKKDKWIVYSPDMFFTNEICKKIINYRVVAPIASYGKRSHIICNGKNYWTIFWSDTFFKFEADENFNTLKKAVEYALKIGDLSDWGKVSMDASGSTKASIQGVLEIISEYFDISISKVKLTSNFKKDFKANENDMLEIIMEIEELFNIDIPDGDISKFKTVNDLIKYLKNIKKNLK